MLLKNFGSASRRFLSVGRAFVIVTCCFSIKIGTAAAQPDFINYQGELRKDGIPYDGTAFAKFAIVADAGTTTLWSHDGTSAAGSEPQTSVSQDVMDGVFSIRLGEAPMLPILAASLSNTYDAVLRMWVDTGSGFEQLSDQPIGSTAFALVCETTNQISAMSTSSVPRWNGSALENGTVFDDGNVGIGTISPAAKLDVAGTIAINGAVVVDNTGRWVGQPGIGPPGAAGPIPAHEWNVTNLRFQNPDLTWGPYVNLLGPPPSHQWNGTSLRFQNPNGTWSSYVNLQGPQGPPGPPVETYCIATADASCSCSPATTLSRDSGDPTCTVSSSTGTCTATGANFAYCCVCRPY